MKVSLMLTCLADAFYGEVGIASARLLESVGCEVDFDARQTCCGQPPFNAGDRESARSVAERNVDLFGDRMIVVPSASCAAMLTEGYEELLGKELDAHEICTFLKTRLPEPKRRIERKVAYHRSCHGRAIQLGDAQIDLLRQVPGLDVVEIGQREQCCGFGGAFSVTHPHVSSRMGQAKLDPWLKAGIDQVVSGDMGCVMHLRGLNQKPPGLKMNHVVEILAEAWL